MAFFGPALVLLTLFLFLPMLLTLGFSFYRLFCPESGAYTFCRTGKLY